MNLVKMEFSGTDLYPYTDYRYENEKTIIILESDRFFFVDSVVDELYKPGRILRISNRDRDDTYSTVKEIYNLKRSCIDRFIPMYGKEWISGRGYITTPILDPLDRQLDHIKNNQDYIPENSDCPQNIPEN